VGVSGRFLELFSCWIPLFFSKSLTSVINTPEKTAIDRNLIHDNGIFLVVTTVTHDGNYSILTRRSFLEAEISHERVVARAFEDS